MNQDEKEKQEKFLRQVEILNDLVASQLKDGDKIINHIQLTKQPYGERTAFELVFIGDPLPMSIQLQVRREFQTFFPFVA